MSKKCNVESMRYDCPANYWAYKVEVDGEVKCGNSGIIPCFSCGERGVCARAEDCNGEEDSHRDT